MSDYSAPQYSFSHNSSFLSNQQQMDNMKQQQDHLKQLQEQRRELEARNNSFNQDFLDFSSVSTPNNSSNGQTFLNPQTSSNQQEDILNRVSKNVSFQSSSILLIILVKSFLHL